MKGNFHVRFLEEGERATVLLYSAIGRIYTDPYASVSSAQSVSHHVCSSLKNPASDTKESAFISLNPRFFYDVIFQTGLTGLTGYVFNPVYPVYPVILSNLNGRFPAPEKKAKLEEVIDAKP